MNYYLKSILITVVIVVLLVYLYINICKQTISTSASTSTSASSNSVIESFEAKETNKVIELLREKYRKYETIEIPISMTNYGRNCMNWKDTNNQAFADYTGNKCITLSS